MSYSECCDGIGYQGCLYPGDGHHRLAVGKSRDASRTLQVDEAEDVLRDSLDPYIDWVADRMEPVRRQLTFDTLRNSAGADTELTRLAEALKRKMSNPSRQHSS